MTIGDAINEMEDKHERECLKLIAERDEAQEAMSQAFYLITGNSPQWSNLFCYQEALQDIDDAQRLQRSEAKKFQKAREVMKFLLKKPEAGPIRVLFEDQP